MHLKPAVPACALSAPAAASALDNDDDPRNRHRRRHGLGCILLTALCAVLAGARSLAAIGQWAANAPQHTLARLGARTTCPVLGLRQAPGPATIRRVITALDPAVLSRRTAAEEAAVLIVHGKTLRGSATAQTPAAHVLAAMTPAGHTAAQVSVGGKTSEIAALGELLAEVEITGCLISAEALHTQTGTACYLVQQRGADYILTAKANQPGLMSQAKQMPWGQAPVLERTRERAHGRLEVPTLKALTPRRIAFPHAEQVVRVHRWVREISTGKVTRTYAYLVTSLPAERAGAERSADAVRGHWRIEARHHIRDVSFGEDASRMRTGNAPQNMAMLRNLAIPLLAGLNCRSIPEAYRWVGYDCFTRPLDLIGLA